MTLREIVDTARSMIVGSVKPTPQFAIKQQVVIRRPVGFSGKTHEIVTGEIAAFADGGRSAVVSIPRPGGTTLRSTVNINQLQPVSTVHGRERVHVNPGFRGQM